MSLVTFDLHAAFPISKSTLYQPCETNDTVKPMEHAKVDFFYIWILSMVHSDWNLVSGKKLWLHDLHGLYSFTDRNYQVP